MFIAGAIVGGVIIAYEDYSDYRDHSNHSNYSKYGDANLVNAINNKSREIERKQYEIDNLRRDMVNRFRNSTEELRRDRNYKGLGYSADYMINQVKLDMQEELEKEIQREKEQLAEIEKMIARINEIELQS